MLTLVGSVYTIVNRGGKKKRELEKSALKKEGGREKRGGKENPYKKNVYKKKRGEFVHTKD